MAAAIGDVSGLGVAAAFSPVPIVAMILLLAGSRGRVNGLLFELGWTAGLALLGVLTLKVLGSSAHSPGAHAARWRGWGELGLGLALLLLSGQQFRRRRVAGQQAPTPAWMAALERTTPARALGLGLLVGVVNPKTAALTVAASGAIAATGASFGGEILALCIFILIAAVGVTVPLTLFLVVGSREASRLARWRMWLTRNSTAVGAALALVLGLYLSLDGIRLLV